MTDATANNKIDIDVDLNDDADIINGVLSMIEKVCSIQSLHEYNWKKICPSFEKSLRLSSSVLNVVSHVCMKSSLCRQKEK